MSHMVDFMLMKRNCLYQINVNFISRGKSAKQISTRTARLLRNCKEWRNVIARM